MGAYEENRRMVKMAKKANEERYEAHSKNNLKRHIGTKFDTTMIGALSRFEEIFGYLWGHGIPENQLNEDEIYFRDKWELARTEILNNGNNQKRAALNEVDQYTVKFNKNNYHFDLRNPRELTENE